MSFDPIPEAEHATAKAALARALYEEHLANAFKPDPFRAALSIWPEAEGKTHVALWAIHARKWHEDETVLDIIEDLREADRQEIQAAKIEKASEILTEEFKLLLKAEMIDELRFTMKCRATVEAKDRIAAMDRLSKLMNLDEKPIKEEAPPAFFGVIGMALREVSPTTFEQMALKQQSELQANVVQWNGEDHVRIIN